MSKASDYRDEVKKVTAHAPQFRDVVLGAPIAWVTRDGFLGLAWVQGINAAAALALAAWIVETFGEGTK